MTLELIIALPVWLIVLAATIEFGFFIANLQQLEMASRIGALAASETNPLPNAGSIPGNITGAIDDQLETAGLEQCHVFLEHNVNGPAVTLEDGGPCTCSPPDPVELPFPTEGEYVRVTVCVEMTEMTPNLLKVFGLDLSGRMVSHASTYRHEGP